MAIKQPPGPVTPGDLLEVVRLLPDVLFRCYKAEDGKIYWSLNKGGLAEQFHLTTKEIVGKSLHELLPGGASPALVEHFEAAFRGEPTVFTNQIGDRHFRHFPQPVRDADGGFAKSSGSSPMSRNWSKPNGHWSPSTKNWRRSSIR